MKFTLEGMKVVESSVVKLLKEDLPIRMSYKLSKLYEVLVAEMERVENLRQQLVRRYGEEDEKGNIRVAKDNLPQFNKEYGELMNETVTVDDFDAIPVDKLLEYSERLEMMGKTPISLSALDIHQLKSVDVLKGE